MLSPEEIMKICLKEAEKAFKENEIPIGAVLVFQDGTLIKDHNRKEKKGFYSHAEFNVLMKALKQNKDDLRSAVLYVTVEPCLMCIGAMIEARISGLVYGTQEPKFGGIKILKEAWKEGRYPHKFPIYEGLLKDDCSNILKKFFITKRK
jgi:tRNA(adenine34) deaminase